MYEEFSLKAFSINKNFKSESESYLNKLAAHKNWDRVYPQLGIVNVEFLKLEKEILIFSFKI